MTQNISEADKAAALAAVMGSMGNMGIVGYGLRLPKRTKLPPRREEPEVEAQAPRTPEEIAARQEQIRREWEERERQQQIAAERRNRKQSQKARAAQSARVALTIRRWEAKHKAEVVKEPEPQPQPIEMPAQKKGIFTGHPLYAYFLRWLDGRKATRKTTREFYKFLTKGNRG
jgi:hypothetical protein